MLPRLARQKVVVCCSPRFREFTGFRTVCAIENPIRSIFENIRSLRGTTATLDAQKSPCKRLKTKAKRSQETSALTATADQKRKVVVVTGPTAVGKTNVSLLLAEAINGEIISADSVQVYRGLDVGSDKVCDAAILDHAKL